MNQRKSNAGFVPRAPSMSRCPAQNLLQRTNHTTLESFSVNALHQLTPIPSSTPAYDRRGDLSSYTRGRDLSGALEGAGGIGGLLARSHAYSGGSWTAHNFYHADGNGNVTALITSGGTLQAN